MVESYTDGIMVYNIKCNIFNYISCHVCNAAVLRSRRYERHEVPAKVVKAQYDAGILPFTVEAA